MTMALKCIQHIMKANLGEQDESWFEKTTGILIILINRYIDKPTLASETHLASLKTKFDKLVVDEIQIHSAGLSRLSHVLDNGVFKKLCMINWLTKSILLMLRCQKLVDVNKKLDVKKKGLTQVDCSRWLITELNYRDWKQDASCYLCDTICNIAEN